MQAELERDTDSLKKEVVDIRLLAQKEMVLDPEAEMLEVQQCRSCVAKAQVWLTGLPLQSHQLAACRCKHSLFELFCFGSRPGLLLATQIQTQTADATFKRCLFCYCNTTAAMYLTACLRAVLGIPAGYASSMLT